MMARAAKKRAAPKPHWMTLRRLGDIPIRCRSCGRVLGRERVYWAPELRARGHRGYFWCDQPQCGGAAYHHYEKPEVNHFGNN